MSRKSQAISRLEKITGDLYSDCFAPLNEVDKHWFAHGRLLAHQLGITDDRVRGKTCLDGGCGNGTLTYRLLTLGAKRVTAVDIHPIPKEKVFDQYREQVEFVTTSLLNLPFPDESFDVVASTGVLQHTADPEKALFELVRVLKKGRTLYLGVYGRHGLFSWVLSLARTFTVRIPVVPMRFVDGVIGWLGLSPLVRYQTLDYLYVPKIIRSSPQQLNKWLLKNGMKNPRRVYAVSTDEARAYRGAGTVYTYDPRTFWNRILFGYGFLNMQSDK